MNCLTKKSLFFIVISIVCNPTFSNKTEECITNLRLVFSEDLNPFLAFKLGMFSLSEKVIRNMTTTVALSNSLLNQYEMFKAGHEELANFRVISSQIGNQNKEITDSKKDDILGYFEFLIYKFDNIYEHDKTEVLSPKKFCEVALKRVESQCRSALCTMLQKNDDDLNQVEVKEAFIYCYLHYNYVDFTNNSIFSALSSSSTNITHDPQLQQYELRIMRTYFRKLMGIISGIARKQLEVDPKLIPTAEEYCEGPGQKKNEEKHSTV